MRHFDKFGRCPAAVRPLRMAGLSLVELMIAVALGLLVLSGVVAVFVNSSTARNEIDRSSRQIENGRYASEILTEDLRLAGFYGELNVGALPSPTSLPDPCSTVIADWVAAIPLHVQGYDNGATPPSCMPTSLKANTDIIAVRRVRTCVAGVAGCPGLVANTPYLQVSLCQSELPATPYVLGLQGAAAFSLRIKDCATAAGMRQYYVNIYFISTDNGAGQNIPTLKRLEFTGSGTPVETPLVEGIEDLQVEYGVDNDGDGAPDTYTTSPVTVADWMNVVTARFFILARNIEASPRYVDNKTYTLGSVTVPAFGDGYRRHVYSGLVRIANPAGRRDTP
jgi:type IV pilus assembly protein PilW